MTDLYNLNEVTISYSHQVKPSEQFKITCSSLVYQLVTPTWVIDIDHKETFKVLLLSRSNRVLGIANLFSGGISGVAVDIKLIFQVAIKCNAASIILMHNHPSGELEVSDADKQMTQKAVKAGKILDLPVLDHIIFTCESYLSMADEGLI